MLLSSVILIITIIGVWLIAGTPAASYADTVETETSLLTGLTSKTSQPVAGNDTAARFTASPSNSDVANIGQNIVPDRGLSSSPDIKPNIGFRSIKGQPLYVHKPVEWSGRPAAIYDHQVGKWYGNWTVDIQAEVNSLVTQATAASQLPLLSAYNIPGRDCGSYSSGGAGNSSNYRSWIQRFADGVGNRKAIIILEADALAQLDCLNASDQAVRIADIAFAVGVFRDRTQASVYIDGGNVGWKSVADMTDRLKRAGVANASGFSLNVSNFKFTDATTAYGDQIVNALNVQGVPNVRYVIDTSRNGRGPAPDNVLSWCNPDGRGLGKRPTTNPTDGTYSDAFLWIKTIGESDGPCERSEPAAGQWFPSYSQMLTINAAH